MSRVVLAPMRQSPASSPISVHVCRMDGMIPAPAAHSNSRMLKKSPCSPAQPRRAETRHFPCFVLGSSKSSTYPRGYASGFDSPAALLDGLFEHPAGRRPSCPQACRPSKSCCAEMAFWPVLCGYLTTPSFDGFSPHSGEFTLQGVNARLLHKQGRPAHDFFPVAV